MKFKHQTVWITGASSGLGEALAYESCRQGAHVILSSRNEQELERVRQQCLELNGGGRVHIETIDLSDSEKLRQKGRVILEKYGPVDYLINNGGVAQRSTVLETQPEIDDTIMQVNFMGAVVLTKAVLPDMIERGKGHIVVISSVLGKMAVPGSATYVASKHALQGYFDALRAEVDRHQIKVTLACPGFIKTNISVNALTSDGTPHKKMDKGQSRGVAPGVCAKKVLKAVARGREEINIGGPEIAAVYIKRWFPWLISRVIKRIKREGVEEPKL